jgi:hypothetical protein
MNATTRTVIAICFALFSVIMALNKCQQQKIKNYKFEHTWTPELETQMRDVFYTQISNIAVNDSAKKEYVDCCFAKIKEMFPNGLSSMKPDEMTDSTKIAMVKQCAECAAILTKQINVWQPDIVQQLKLQFYSYPEVKQLPEAAKSEYVDCLTFKVKTQFPSGLSKAGKDSVKSFIEKARRGCLILVANKYKKQKIRDTTGKK